MRAALRTAGALLIGVAFGTAVIGLTGSWIVGSVLGGVVAVGVDGLLAPEEPEPDPLRPEWTCHVCGDLRPDEMIDLIQRERRMGPGKLIVNVRYCRDRDSCAAGAEELAETWLDVARDR